MVEVMVKSVYNYDNDAPSRQRFTRSSTSLAPSLLGYYDSLATKVTDEPNVNGNTESSVAEPTTTSIKTASSSLSVSQQSITTITERSCQSSKLKTLSFSNGSSLRPTRVAPQLPKSGDKFRNLSNNVARILSNTETAVDSKPNRPRPPPAPFHRNQLHSLSFNSGRTTTSTSRFVLKNIPLSRNITKLSHLGREPERECTNAFSSPDTSNGNCDTSIEEDIPKLSFIQQRIKSLTSALFDNDEDSEVAKNQVDQQPASTVQDDVDPEPVLRNPEKSMEASQADQQDAFVENCDESENRNTIKKPNATAKRPFPRNLQISPKLPRSTSTSTPSLDTSSASLSSSKTSLTQQNAPGTPVLSTRPLSASSICSYSSSSSSGSEHLLLVNGKCCGAPSYQASVESLADQSECEQSATGSSGLTMCERAVREIIDSERSFVEDLGQIIKGNIQEIWDFNSRLLNRLNETKGDPVKISGCFIDLHEDFDCYTTYCTRYPEAIALLTSLLQATHTNALLIHTQKMLNHNLPLGSYLLKPVQRILKYHLLLDNLRKHCDDKQVAHAHELMKSGAHNIDQVKKKLEQQSRVKELAGIVDGWLGPDLSVLGELRQEGLLSEHAKPRVVLLFQTMLIITKPKEDKRLQFRAYIPCKNLMLVEHLPGEPTSFNVIPYNDPKGQIKLTARNRDQKRHWAQQIKQAMLEHFDIPKRAKELVLQLGDEDDRMADKNASWKWPTHHPSTPEYLERRQQFRRSEMRMRSKKMRKNTASSISLDGISQKDVKQPTFQSYSKALEQEGGGEEAATTKDDSGGCKCDSVKKELEQKQLKNRSRSETRLQEDRKGLKMSDEEIFAKAMAERNRFATQRRKTKESLVDVKSYNTTTIPKRIANIRKTRSKTLTGNSTFYTDLELGDGEEDTTVLKITESTDNLSLVDAGGEGEVEVRKSGGAKEMMEEEGSPRRDSDIISQLVLEKTEFRKMSRPPKKKSFDSVRSLSCTSQEEDGGSDRREVEEEQALPELPKTEPPEEIEEDEFREVDELNKESEDLLNRLNEIQSDLTSPEPIYESLLRNVHVPYKYAPPLTRSVSQQYGKGQESSLKSDAKPKRSRPDSDYVTLAYSENGLVNIDGQSVVPKSSIAQLRNSDTNINYHHPWRKDEESGPVQDTRSEIVTLASEDALKPLERQGSLSIKSPKNLLQRFISLHASPSTTGSCDSNLNQRKISNPEDPTPIYKQGSLDLGSRIANLDYADPRTLFTSPNQQPNILINRGSLKPLYSADLEQRDSIFSLNSSNDSVCGVQIELEDDSCGFYEKSVEECLENEDFRDSAVYSGDDNRPDLDDQVVYESIGEINQQRQLLRPTSQVARSSSSASSSSSGPPPPVPVKPAHLEQMKKVKPRVASGGLDTSTPTKVSPAPKGWVLQQVKRFQ
ncbi:hypothetical protein RP20_CCG019585 [Aedes albopictus]|nr:hypothetical protein RP20_CCG019585 [Aedes albopictus]